MPPNAKNLDFAVFETTTHEDILETTTHEDILKTRDEDDDEKEITAYLDKQSDTNGLKQLAGEDWTDVKHSERKKQDRILKDGVVLKLMQKSDYEGFKRLFTNLAILFATAYCLQRLDIFPFEKENLSLKKVMVFIPLYLFYGFQFQCFAFAGQHEFLHGNAFKTKWINELVLFVFGTTCFEFGKHERLMHKQHHTFTNNIDKDPELTSYYSREELENPKFRNVARDKWAYFRQFLFVWETILYRLRRIFMSARGIPVDYSGRGWSMATEKYSEDSGIMRDLQNAARLQLLAYTAIFAIFGNSSTGVQALFFWWIVPVILGYPAVNYFRNLEHADCPASTENNSLKNTRTVRSNFVIRQLLWNTNFHVEHHTYPMVPFFNLPKLSELMDEHCLHNECRHFTSQNWECVKSGGWIDKQSVGFTEKKES